MRLITSTDVLPRVRVALAPAAVLSPELLRLGA
jgi:hypothetical protein